MEKNSKDFEAIVLKGIASQLLQMNKPSMQQAAELFNTIGFVIVPEGNYNKAVDDANVFQSALVSMQLLVQDARDTLEERDPSISFWIKERYDETLEQYDLHSINIQE